MDTLPPWMDEPTAPQPEAGGPWFPHIIDQRSDGEGNVLVTWALPGLRTGTVRVPQAAWMAGEHHHIPPTLADLASFAPAPPDQAFIDDDSEQGDYAAND